MAASSTFPKLPALLKQLALATAATTSTHDPCQFVCSDTRCLPSITLVCDGHSHCADGADEADCPSLLLLYLEAPTPDLTSVLQRGTTTEHQQGHNHSLALQIVVVIISVVVVVSIVACVVSLYKMGARSWSSQHRDRQTQSPEKMQQQQQLIKSTTVGAAQQKPQQPNHAIATPFPPKTIIYSQDAIQERQRYAVRALQDHMVQIQSVQTDLVLDLPHSVALPDGEEPPHHYCLSGKQNYATSERHAEIMRNFVKPPPNRTAYEVDSLPPFRSNSVGILHKPVATAPSYGQTATDCTSTLVTRSYSVSSSCGQGSRSCYTQKLAPTNSAANYAPLGLATSVASQISNSGAGISGDAKNYSDRTYSSSETSNNVDPHPPRGNQWDTNVVNKQNGGV